MLGTRSCALGGPSDRSQLPGHGWTAERCCPQSPGLGQLRADSPPPWSRRRVSLRGLCLSPGLLCDQEAEAPHRRLLTISAHLEAFPVSPWTANPEEGTLPSPRPCSSGPTFASPLPCSPTHDCTVLTAVNLPQSQPRPGGRGEPHPLFPPRLLTCVSRSLGEVPCGCCGHS